MTTRVDPDQAASPTQGLSRDRGRLLRLHSAWRRSGSEVDAESYREALAASVAKRTERAARLPQVAVDPELPIAAHVERLAELIARHQVLVVAGETGSGKTTQLPKLCLAAGRGAAGMIGCTQPRRIAARSVARRVAEELGVELGGLVGFQVRFNDRSSEDTAVKFMTDGILLAEIASDRWLSRYDTLIIDEAHERSLNIDFLLGYLQGLLRRRPDLKLIVTSATIDTERFARHFGDAPVVSVEGRGHPVEVRWRPTGLDADAPDPEARGARAEDPMTAAILAATDEITAEDPRGDVLVFLPGEREIRDLHRLLERRGYRATEVLPLYARLSARDQDRVFKPGPGRRIVLATNVAETSLTVPRIRYVVDPGLARIKRYSPRQKIDRLHVEPISQASATQRAGRCGRVSAGIAYRLYDEADFDARPRHTDPEIRRASLAGVILRMLELKLGAIDQFPFIDPPDGRAIADGWQQLAELGAVDERRQLTAIGRQMARLPVDPKLARMLVEAERLGCLAELLPIAAFLGIQDPRERPADQRQAADQAHAVFADRSSEFVAILNLWRAYRDEHEARTQSKLREWCQKSFLNFLRMREWRELHRQLRLVTQQFGWNENSEPARYAELHLALLSGLPTQVGHRDPKGRFEAPRQRRFRIFPGSPLAKSPPRWVLSAVLLDTRELFGLVNARIEPDWILRQAAHLLQRRVFDPHWSRKHGCARAFEQVTLLGLTLAARRPLHFGPIDPVQARQLLIRDGLVTGEIDCRAPFVARNLQTLLEVAEEEAKLRRADLVADADWQAAFYDQALPADITTAKALDAWYRRLPLPGRQALEWTREQLLTAPGGDAGLYPAELELGGERLALRYRFEPGAADDGVTLVLPLHLLRVLKPERPGWLVPGLLADRVAALIRALPKALRRNFVPAPDFARAFVESLGELDTDAPLLRTLTAFLARRTGVEVPASAWDETSLPPHLLMNLRLVDGEQVLAESRQLEPLLEEFGERAERAFAERAGRDLERTGLDHFPESGVPESVPGAAGLEAYPALAARGDGIELAVFPRREDADRAHAEGVRALLERALAPRLRQAARQLTVTPRIELLYAALAAGAGSDDSLREALVQGAARALYGDELARVRTIEDWRARLAGIESGLFPEAVRRLAQAEKALAAYAEIKPKLEPPLMGFAAASYADMRACLERLVHPGFLRDTPATALAELPRYLEALSRRADRVGKDPSRDEARMLELAPFERALEQAAAEGRDHEPGWQSLRWRLEEWRVSLFAQDLGTREPVSAKRLSRDLTRLTTPN